MAAILNDTHLSSINIDLSSDDAVYKYSDTHVVFQLDKQIELPDENHHYLIGLTAFNMSFTFYQIRTGVNDTFTISTYDGVTTLNALVTIPPGNYTMVTMAQALNTVFTGIKSSLGLTTLSIQRSVTTAKFTMSCLPLMETITFSNITPYIELGLTSADYVFTSVTSLQFPYVVNLSSDASLYIQLHDSDIYNLNSRKINGILCNVPCKYAPTEVIYYNPAEIQYFKSKSFNSKRIEISILSQSFEDIAVLNTETPFRLTISVHFSKDKIHPNLRKIKPIEPIETIPDEPRKRKKKKKKKKLSQPNLNNAVQEEKN